MSEASLEAYRSQSGLKDHLYLVDYYMEIVHSVESVFAAVLVGSFAAGSPDGLSDLDMILFAEDGKGETAFGRLSGRKPLPILNRHQGGKNGEFYFEKTIFEKLVGLELFVFERSSKIQIKKPYLVLKDSKKFLSTKEVPGDPPRHEDFETLSLGGDNMGWALYDLLKWWSRGKEELVRTHFLKIAEGIKNKSKT